MNEPIGDHCPCCGAVEADWNGNYADTDWETMDRLRARVAELEGKARAVLSANDDFRAGMPANWEGDPLQDACADLRSILTETAPPLRDLWCPQHGRLTERCSTCDCHHAGAPR